MSDRTKVSLLIMSAILSVTTLIANFLSPAIAVYLLVFVAGVVAGAALSEWLGDF